MMTLHGSGIPHVDTWGVSPWVQWSVIAVILLVGCWLLSDVRARTGGSRGLVEEQPEDLDGPLVVGRSSRQATGVAEAPSAVSAPGRSPLIPPVPLPPAEAEGRGKAARATDGADRQVTAANCEPTHCDGSPSETENGATAHVRRVVAARRMALPIWLNPIRVLAAVLGIGAGVQAVDRVRAIMELDAMLGTTGTFQVSRIAIWLTVLFCAGGLLAMLVPKLAAAAFLGAAALAAFCAMADWWESRLEWWGAEYALTAWSNLWIWVGIGVGLAALSLVGGRYRTGITRGT